MKVKRLFFLMMILLATSQISMKKVFAEEDSQGIAYVDINLSTGEEKVVIIEENFNEEDEVMISLPYDVDNNTNNLNSRIMMDGDLKPVDATSGRYSRILCLRMSMDIDDDGIHDMWATGTGFMVYTDIMLTAGHNLYDKQHGRILEMKAYIKQNGEILNGVSYTIDRFSVMPELVRGEYAQYDWCIAVLPTEIGRTIGYFGYGVLPASTTKWVTVSGYPGADKYTFTQYASMNTLMRYNPYYFQHKCDTVSGMSGAPAFDGNGIVWGIHTGHCIYDSSYNAGMVITSYLYNRIESLK